MRPVLYVFTFLAVMSLGFWAYRENYATQAALRDVMALQDEIAGLRESLSVERAEWAYLNRPARLRELATLNFDRLLLLPMEPSQFGVTSAVAYPPPPIAADMAPLNLEVNTPIDVQGETPATDGQTP